MATHDNAPPPADWVCEPRCCPFENCGICETAQHAVFIHGTDNVVLGEN